MAREKEYRFKSDEGRNATILIGVLLIAVLIVGGGLLYIIMQKMGSLPAIPAIPLPNQTVNATNQTPVVPVCDEACLYARAVASHNPALCANLSGQYVQQCYENLSAVSLDACKALADAPKRQSCITAAAVLAGNLSLCDLAGNRTACRYAVDPCADAAGKALCHALAANDSSLCNSDTFCLLNYSAAKTSAASCGLIQNPVIAAACTSAVKRRDSCSNLQLQSQKDYCYELYALYTGDYLVCTQISPDSSYSLDCFSSFAASAHNLSICNQDGLSLNSLWACYINYSLMTGDLAGCYQIDSLATTNIFQCAFQYAVKYGDPSACQVITNTLTQRATCYEGSIIYSNRNLNWSNCLNVTDFNWKNKCYTESAKITNNVSICKYAVEAYAQQSCRDAYAANHTG